MKKSVLEILETDSEAAHKLRLLSKYEGWKMLVEILIKNEVEPLADKLRSGEYKTIEDRNRDRDKLNNLETLLNAPMNYVGILSGEIKIEQPPMDPYAQNIEEAKKISQGDH